MGSTRTWLTSLRTSTWRSTSWSACSRSTGRTSRRSTSSPPWASRCASTKSTFSFFIKGESRKHCGVRMGGGSPPLFAPCLVPALVSFGVRKLHVLRRCRVSFACEVLEGGERERGGAAAKEGGLKRPPFVPLLSLLSFSLFGSRLRGTNLSLLTNDSAILPISGVPCSHLAGKLGSGGACEERFLAPLCGVGCKCFFFNSLS